MEEESFDQKKQEETEEIENIEQNEITKTETPQQEEGSQQEEEFFPDIFPEEEDDIQIRVVSPKERESKVEWDSMEPPRNNSKTAFVLILLLVVAVVGFAAILVWKYNGFDFGGGKKESPAVTSTAGPTPTAAPEPIVAEEGMTIQSRFRVPAGYERVPVEENSFAEYLRSYKLKTFSSQALLYDGKLNPEDHRLGVLDQSIAKTDLQQCADTCIRLWAEYLFGKYDYDKISFDFYNTPPFQCAYSKWAMGLRVKVENNKCSWVGTESEKADYSAATFQKYLEFVYNYANTNSLQAQMISNISASDLRIGDIFIITTAQTKAEYGVDTVYGHCVIIMDMAVHAQTGEKIYLIAQGNTPATQPYMLRSDNTSMVAWHTLQEDGTLKIGDWSCPAKYIRRFG